MFVMKRLTMSVCYLVQQHRTPGRRPHAQHGIKHGGMLGIHQLLNIDLLELYVFSDWLKSILIMWQSLIG